MTYKFKLGDLVSLDDIDFKTIGIVNRIYFDDILKLKLCAYGVFWLKFNINLNYLKTLSVYPSSWLKPYGTKI